MFNVNTAQLHTTYAVVRNMYTEQINTSTKCTTDTYEINANSTDITLSIGVILITRKFTI